MYYFSYLIAHLFSLTSLQHILVITRDLNTFIYKLRFTMFVFGVIFPNLQLFTVCNIQLAQIRPFPAQSEYELLGKATVCLFIIAQVEGACLVDDFLVSTQLL